MDIRFSKENDVNISLEPKKSVSCSLSIRKEVAARLFQLVKDRKLVNVRRTLAVCPVCKNYCTYFPGGEEVARNFAKSTIVDRRDGFDITIPVELIHILADHPEIDVDANLLDHYRSGAT